MTSDELRTAFLSFFEEKGHTIVPSSSLIPRGDPTLLLTSAGMVQFKPYFLGEALPPNRRLASCQKCFRNTDIESVGDPSHLTFFEMLGNFSIGDYFKQEAINWAWEFVTQRLELPPERLWITIFLDDEESFRYWQEVGVPEHRILRFGEEDNFWGPAGNSGPCGPCSEILYDFGEGVGCSKASCAPGCDCGRFSELWNLVFTQYNQDEGGHRTLLPRPNIDTGMGLERTAAVVQGKTSVYETGLFASLLDNISKYIGKKYGTDDDADYAMRVIVEHGRALAFLIADGVIPSNEGRGYVLRRLLRRAALFGRRLGLDKPFLKQIAGATVGHMGRIYPELEREQNKIYSLIGDEERRFEETLNTGLELIENIMAEWETDRAGEISGVDAFRLYDTYGFPVELTKEIAVGRGLLVNLEGFEREMEKQRERARAARRIVIEEGILTKEGFQPTSLEKDLGELKFVGYHNLSSIAKVVSINFGDVDKIEQGDRANIILSETPFYGEMGGQVGDTGEICGASGQFLVTCTTRVPPDIVVHQGQVTEGSLTVGDEVEAVVDRERRLDIARNHTATHLVQFALRQLLGKHVQQRGSLVMPERFSFDFSHMAGMTEQEGREVQHIVNEKIRQNLTVYDEEVQYKKAIEEGAIALFDEKYSDVVRVVRIGEPVVSAELCGGTHVASTGEIGFFHISGEHSIGAGLRRIEAVTGRQAEAFIERRLSSLTKIASRLATEVEDTLDKVDSLVTELKNERKQRLALNRELSWKIAESLLSQAEVINGVAVLSAKVPSSRLEALREMSDRLREQLKSGIIVLGTVYEDKPVFLAAVTPDLVARGYDAGEIVKQVAGVAGGGGGGKAGLAQAGGKHREKLDEALRLVKSLI